MLNRRDNSGFFAGADAVATFVLSNFVWVVVSLTIVGIPLATVGLFAVMSQWIRGRQPEFFSVFFGTIRQNWKQALVIGLIDFVAGAFVFINLSILGMMNPTDMMAIMSRSLTIALACLVVAVNIYVWFLMATIDLPVKRLIKLGLILVVTYPLRNLLLTILSILPLIISLFLPPLFYIFISVSATVLIASYGAWKIVQAHFTQQELEEYNIFHISTDHNEIL